MASLSIAAQDDRQPAGQQNRYLEVGKNLDIFNNVYKHLDLLYVDTLDPQRTITAAINGMLRSLDPYTEYYPESETKRLEQMITGKYAGIGALIRQHLRLNRPVIDEPYAGMPAAEAGLRKGDIIISIDDTLMQGKPIGYVSSHLRGDPGTSFLLKIVRPTASPSAVTFDKKGRATGGTEMTMRITRRNIKLSEISNVLLLADSIGYIGLTQFTEGCAREVRKSVIDLKNRGAHSLVLDLRGNGGGSEMEAVELVNIFVPKGQTVVENRGKVAAASRTYRTQYEPVDTLMPLVVLVDGETASASEITAGALQDLDRATVLGTKTFGKGLVQLPIDLPYNASLKITTSKYYIPSGRCIQAINYTKGRTDDRRPASLYGDRVPDSLTHVFHTRAGREVRDGGGITPDVVLANDTMPNIAYYLSTTGLDSTEVLFDYVVDYISAHPTIASPMEFHLSDAEWADFCRRVSESGFAYDALSKSKFDELVKVARFEGYYDEAREAFDALERQLHHDVTNELTRHRSTIQKILEMDIISAYYYERGSHEVSLTDDRQLLEARRLLRERHLKN